MNRSTIDLRLMLRDDADPTEVLRIVAELARHGDVIFAQLQHQPPAGPTRPRDGWTRTWPVTA